MIPPIQPKVQVPTMDSYQTDSTFVLSIFTKRPSVSKADVIAEILEQNKFRCVIRFHGPEHHAFSVKMTLAEKASMKSSSVKISK